MKNPLTFVAITCFFIGCWWTASQPNATAHCQMPCGIYDDPARIAGLQEDALTIRKAVTSLKDLDHHHEDHRESRSHELLHFNQATRWVITKDQHAQNIQDVTSSYFLTQRVSAVPEDDKDHGKYVAQLKGFHRVLVAAMKCKQTADLASVDELDAAIAAVAKWYKGKDKDKDRG